MKTLGIVEEITSDGRFIIRCEELPDIGDQVFSDKGPLGTVGRVFGPVDGPYASVSPAPGARTSKGGMTFFRGRKRDAKDKRRNRRDRGLPGVRQPPPGPRLRAR